MKHWQEMGHIVERVLHLGREGRTVALAIVTQIDGSAYRRPGAKLLIEDDGSVLGGVSGGCLEEDVRQMGLAVIQTGRARVRSYDTGADETPVFGLGLGCEGRVDVVVHPIAPALSSTVLAQLKTELQKDSALALSVVAENGVVGGMLLVGKSGALAGSLGDSTLDAAAVTAAQASLETEQSQRREVGSRQVFTEVLMPPPKLLICGGGDDARPLADAAAAVGFRVYVVDHRPAHLTAERFPSARQLLKLRPQHPSPELPADRTTYAVVKTHALEHDTAWVKRLLATEVPYVGVLGPRARIHKILDDLGTASSERVFGPVGLDIGADGPEQVALSIVAEVLAVFARRRSGHLREREAALHAKE